MLSPQCQPRRAANLAAPGPCAKTSPLVQPPSRHPIRAAAGPTRREVSPLSDHPAAAAPRPLASRTAQRLAGTAKVPGDKSISHRSLMLGALAVGETEIHGLLEGEDVLRTAAAMRLLGGTAEKGGDGVWRAR